MVDREIELMFQNYLHTQKANIFELTEFDQWVNDATRACINKILDKYKNEVFGIEFWSWHILCGEQLRDANNFSVDVIFKNCDFDKVKNAIINYEKKKINNAKVIDTLFNDAVFVCTWV
ncbi:MAG: hypothetical protein NWF09_07520 [Candidatus Bathyarchaeota archaeon]|nr:hypothetical protein [Candidatus Bathyarchaeota archaeon]